MFKQAKKVVLGVGALAALALGGSAIAQAGSHPAQHTSTSAVEKVAKVDVGTTQSGDQSTPDTAGSTSEAPGTETSASSESNSSSESSASESTPSDGPGGHADAPGNSSVDHQFNGQE